jgi:methylenetetrahydrofolate dehydrogenase (NADP+)/methenyltetrahydrofolate cyclohydrolase
MTETLSGKELAADIRDSTILDAAALAGAGIQPKLAVVVATADESTASYVRSIAATARRTGIACDIIDLGPGATTQRIYDALVELGHDPDVHGIILQTPLPDGVDVPALREAINYAKDVDGAGPTSLGRLTARMPAFAPATAEAVVALLDYHRVALRGRPVTVVGRSTVVGVPAAHLLLQRDATVTVCHRYTTDLAASTRSAEVLVVAVGVPGLIEAEHIAEGAVLIDVGTTADADRGLLGDIDAASVQGRAGALTPVPGGVGPVTTALLLRHTVESAMRHSGRKKSLIGSIELE